MLRLTNVLKRAYRPYVNEMPVARTILELCHELEARGVDVWIRRWRGPEIREGLAKIAQACPHGKMLVDILSKPHNWKPFHTWLPYVMPKRR